MSNKIGPSARLQGANLKRKDLKEKDLSYSHLEDAHLEESNLERANLQGAFLQRAHLEGAFLEGAKLTFAHLEEAHLDGVDLTKVKNLKLANLYKAHLEGAILSGVDLRGVDLRGAHLEGAHLEGADLREAHLEGAFLNGVDLRGVDLRGTHLERAILNGVDLRGVDLRGTHLIGAHFKNAHLEGAHLERAILEVANFEGAFLIEAHLEGASLPFARFEGANLRGAHLEGAFLKDAHFEGAFLQGAFLERAILAKGHLEGAHLEGAILQRAILGQADLRRAILVGADLRGADLTRAHLEGSILRDAHLEGATFSEVDLRIVDLNGVNLRGADLRGAYIHREQLTGFIAAQMQARELARQERPSSSEQIIIIPRRLNTLSDFSFGHSNNSNNKSCPDFRHLYEFIMEQDLTENFRFKFEGENAIDLTGLTRQVFDKILPVYVHLFFIKNPGEEFILLKKDVNMDELNQHTIQLIKLAKAAHAQIILRINPEVIEFLSLENPPKSIANNQNFNKLYAIFKAQINSSGNNVSNYLLNNSLKPKINAAKGNLDALNRALKQEILFRKKLNDFGFKSLEQYYNMARFIKTFWNTSNENKVTVNKNRHQITLDLFVSDFKFDIESFKRRIKIIRQDTGIILDLNSIPIHLFQNYPALKPLLKYIFDESPEGDNRRRTFTKYIAGTEYYPGDLRIILTMQQMSPRLYDNSPFYGHSCDTRVDLFMAPPNYNGEITANGINIALKTNTSRLEARE
jgi:uncharacterized protein YjbI with pentapeptide repeats